MIQYATEKSLVYLQLFLDRNFLLGQNDKEFRKMVDELNDEYDFLDKNGVRLFALEWCQQRGLSSLDDLEIIGKI